jgi:hypothetical protein
MESPAVAAHPLRLLSSLFLTQPANPTSFAILFIAANNQLQSPSVEDDVLSSAGRDQIAADEDERAQHQDEIERVHRQRTIMLVARWSDKRSQPGGSTVLASPNAQRTAFASFCVESED